MCPLCALGLGAGAAAECRCRMFMAVCALELGCWCRCRLLYAAARFAWSCALWSVGAVPLQDAAALESLGAGAATGCRCRACPQLPAVCPLKLGCWCWWGVSLQDCGDRSRLRRMNKQTAWVLPTSILCYLGAVWWRNLIR